MKELVILLLKCKKNLVIEGRVKEPEVCFTEGNTYVFIYGDKKDEIVSINDIGFPHFFGKDEDYTQQYFDLEYEGLAIDCGVDEFTLKRIEILINSLDDYALN